MPATPATHPARGGTVYVSADSRLLLVLPDELESAVPDELPAMIVPEHANRMVVPPENPALAVSV